MSRDIIVLTPNGRRFTVHCTPDTSILQVLEDICGKHGFEADNYNLKHHNHVLDLTSTIRFSNLPNRACLEMVETENRREVTNVTVALVLEDGQRLTAEFPPSTSLFDLVSQLASNELSSLQNPAVQYMRQEVIGIDALKGRTLRQLGLIHGRAILRLLNKAEEQMQANVSVVYNVKPKAEVKKPEPVAESHKKIIENAIKINDTVPESSNLLEQSKDKNNKGNEPQTLLKGGGNAMDVDETASTVEKRNPGCTPEELERRLKIEEEVTFIGSHKSVAFSQPDESTHEELDDLPDDFYELSVEEVRRLYKNLQEQRAQLENAPLLTTSKKEEMTNQQPSNTYKNAVVRIQFPDRIILQGIFSPSDTIGDVSDFIRQHLRTPEKPFHVFTTPMKENLTASTTLTEARFVPCVHMHFKWSDELDGAAGPYLKQEIYTKQTPIDAVKILASKYRAPTRRKMDAAVAGPSRPAAGSSKVPKWFKK